MLIHWPLWLRIAGNFIHPSNQNLTSLPLEVKLISWQDRKSVV